MVVAQSGLSRMIQRILRRLMRHVGISILIAADPRSEFHQPRQHAVLHINSVNLFDGCRDLLVKFRDGLEENTRVVQPHLDLIEYRRRRAADFIGLPEGSDLDGDFLLDFQSVRAGKREIV